MSTTKPPKTDAMASTSVTFSVKTKMWRRLWPRSCPSWRRFRCSILSDSLSTRFQNHIFLINPNYLQVADGLANSCGGILRGQGRQHLGAAFNLVAYYILALPLGLSLAFKFGQGM